jgi:ABC-type transporter Mla subunit MlaD
MEARAFVIVGPSFFMKDNGEPLAAGLRNTELFADLLDHLPKFVGVEALLGGDDHMASAICAAVSSRNEIAEINIVQIARKLFDSFIFACGHQILPQVVALANWDARLLDNHMSPLLCRLTRTF